jgi:hypothetical protein
MNIEINLEDVFGPLLVVSKHVYNCNRVFKAADHIHVGIAGHKIVTSYKLLTNDAQFGNVTSNIQVTCIDFVNC